LISDHRKIPAEAVHNDEGLVRATNRIPVLIVVSLAGYVSLQAFL
jgi:hypothetical protein